MFLEKSNGIVVFKKMEINELVQNSIKIAKNLKVGEYKKIIFDNDIFIIAQNTMLKDKSDCIYESHKKYIDIHYSIEGTEDIEVININDIGKPYESNFENDYYLYSSNYVEKKITLDSNELIIFSFDDVHKVGINQGNNNSIIKIVIKITKEIFEKEFTRE
mgnify:CR=1 FL=1